MTVASDKSEAILIAGKSVLRLAVYLQEQIVPVAELISCRECAKSLGLSLGTIEVATSPVSEVAGKEPTTNTIVAGFT